MTNRRQYLADLAQVDAMQGGTMQVDVLYKQKSEPEKAEGLMKNSLNKNIIEANTAVNIKRSNHPCTSASVIQQSSANTIA